VCAAQRSQGFVSSAWMLGMTRRCPLQWGRIFTVLEMPLAPLLVTHHPPLATDGLIGL
jgi:hypothetical protein